MGGFRGINIPGLNFQLTPEAIDAARAAQGLPPLNGAPPPDPGFQLNQTPFGPNAIQAPTAAPGPMPPVASPAGDPTIVQNPVQAFAGRPEPMAERPSIGQGVGSFLLNERFGQNIPVEPRVPPPIIDSEGIPAVITPPPVIAPPPPPPAPAPAPVVAPPVEDGTVSNDMGMSDFLDRQALEALTPVATPAPAPVTAPLASMRDRLANSSLNQFLGLNKGRPMSSETRWGQPVPAQRPRATPTPTPPVVEPPPPPPPEPTPPAIDEGIASLTRDAIASTQYPGLEGFDPANPLNPVAAPAPEPAPAPTPTPTPAASTGPLTGGPPVGYQGGGGEYNPQNGFTDEDRIAADAFYAEQRRAQREQEFADREAAQPAPPPPVVEAPPVEEDYVDVVVPEPEPPAPPPPPPTPEPELDIPPPPPPEPPPPLFEPTPTVPEPPSPAPEPEPLPPAPAPPPPPPPEEDFVDVVIPEPPPPPAPEPAPAPEPEPAPAPEPEPQEPIEIEPEQPLPQYRYSPYVPRDFQYVVPEFARNFGPFAGFAPGPFRGGIADSELDVGYGDVTAPELSLAPATYQPIPSFQVAQPEYVQIQGPSAPVVDPFATPIQPEFAPLPSYERPVYSPQTQNMVDQILSEEELANPFMNPYLRSGVFGRG